MHPKLQLKECSVVKEYILASRACLDTSVLTLGVCWPLLAVEIGASPGPASPPSPTSGPQVSQAPSQQAIICKTRVQVPTLTHRGRQRRSKFLVVSDGGHRRHCGLIESW